mgnify:FL=1
MPLTINVGLSRKASRDFQSTGTSINLTAELDQSLLSRPEELQEKIQKLYQMAEDALDRQSGPATPDQPAARRQGYSGQPQNPRNGRSGRPSTMTQSQKRAIEALGRRLGLDPAIESQEVLGVNYGELSIRQASDLITHLRTQENATSGVSRGAATRSNGRNGGGH